MAVSGATDRVDAMAVFQERTGCRRARACSAAADSDPENLGGVAVERDAGTDEIFCAGFSWDDVVEMVLLGEKSGGISGVNPLRMKAGGEDLVDCFSKGGALELILLRIQHVGGGEVGVDAGEAQRG